MPPLKSRLWRAAGAFSRTFYRADLTDYTPFAQPVNLVQVFRERRSQLEAYFDANKTSRDKKNIFFVRQAGRVQCLNGAYLSEVDDGLLSVAFRFTRSWGREFRRNQPGGAERRHQRAASQHQSAGGAGRLRSGRQKPSMATGAASHHCDVDDRRFLVGSHIARWSDNETLRGQLSNGLCLCVFHDKAFELGLFTLDEERRIFLSPKERSEESAVMARLML